MKTYRVQLHLKSALATPLAADTLWGHIAWGIRYEDGEADLTSWLEQYDAATDAAAKGDAAIEPPLVISDPLPAGWWPVPKMPPPPRPAELPSKEDADSARDLARRAWMSKAGWQQIVDRGDPVDTECLRRLLEEDAHRQKEAEKRQREARRAGEDARSEDPAAEDNAPPSAIEETTAHAAINRLTWSTTSEGGGTLHARRRWWYPPGTRFDVWAAVADADADADGAALQRLFEQGLAFGYGKHASAGLGHLDVERVERVDQPFTSPIGASNAGILLGWAVPKPNDPPAGFAEVETRSGRLGGLFATGPTPSGSGRRQKRAIFGLTRGSVLVAADGDDRGHNRNEPLVIGQLMRNVHPDEPAIRHYAMTLLLPCSLSDHALAEARTPSDQWCAGPSSAGPATGAPTAGATPNAV